MATCAVVTAALAGLTSTQLVALTTAQVAALTSTQLAKLSTTQIAAMETVDVASLPGPSALCKQINRGFEILPAGRSHAARCPPSADTRPKVTGSSVRRLQTPVPRKIRVYHN